MDIQFYTLLYVDKGEKRMLSMKTWEGQDRIDLFVKNACILDKSLKLNDYQGGVIVLTNDSDAIETAKEHIGYADLKYEVIDFKYPVPKGISFYSAHFKIDVYDYLSKKDANQYSFLIDNDIVCLKPFSQRISNIIENKSPMIYFIPSSDHEFTLDNLRKMTDLNVMEWCGGEFVGGVGSFWGDLYNEVMKVSDKYLALCRENGQNRPGFHVGDEMLTSIAIEHMRRRGYVYYDVATINAIYRYWGNLEKYPVEHYDPSLLHLPYDKVWLANFNLSAFDSNEYFAKQYKKHYRMNRLKAFVKMLIGRKNSL